MKSDIFKLKWKSGFTLVECIVSIAVFAIMALLVATIISAALQAHDSNKQTSRNLITQKESLASRGSGATDTTTDTKRPGGTVTITFEGATATFGVKRVVMDSDSPGYSLGAEPKDWLEVTNIKLTDEASLLDESKLRNPPPPPPASP